MKHNTVVTIGDINYLWGIFLMIASMRKEGMDEPVVVGGKGFTAESHEILSQLGDVTIYPLDNVDHSLTCYKGEVMLQAKTDYISWVDSDAFFIGNCSKRLIPLSENQIHIRLRQPYEMPQAFKGYEYGEAATSIPKVILNAWQADIGERKEARYTCSCSACYLSVHRKYHDFLMKWQEQMLRVLPVGNVGVVDRTLKYYHQLDESVLNSVLNFFENAPQVSEEFRLNKDPNELFVHFIGQPKPWMGWPPSAFRHFDHYVAVVDYALAQGWKLPTELPYCLKHSNKELCRLLQHWVNLRYKIRRRLKSWF